MCYIIICDIIQYEICSLMWSNCVKIAGETVTGQHPKLVNLIPNLL